MNSCAMSDLDMLLPISRARTIFDAENGCICIPWMPKVKRAYLNPKELSLASAPRITLPSQTSTSSLEEVGTNPFKSPD